MNPSTHIQLSTTTADARVDAANGIIRGVAVITEGIARGHDMHVDKVTLQQVIDCAKSYTGGLKVKLNHGSGAGDILGTLKNMKVAGDKVTADLHLLKNSPHRAYVLELAEAAPRSFGLSISFSGQAETKEGVRFARCAEIYSADLVDEPAANPNGLFSTGTAYAGEKFESIVAAKAVALGSTGKAIQWAVQHRQAAHRAYLARCAAGEKIDLAAPAATTGAKFENLVAAVEEARGKGKADAIAYCVQNHPAAHKAFLARCYSGERIAL